ncbi:LexA family protein [Agathobaculum sp. Marseille-P7918]|uniref:LexA family protein n=1 Tax=Agathobaculum sp. Marseille-P7918 TaxID=2479843 RepID=UPI0013DDB973|nr:LexA family transcriptional regulator [Agathobaculum sp. Marseille-P7918]
MSIGDNIKFLREKAGLSQVDFAKMFGVTDKAVSTWENETRIPRMGVIEKIAAAFGVTKSQILDEEMDRSLPNNIILLPKMNKVPLVGQIACGTPILAEENITDYVDLPAHIRADYALTCKGDSMIGAGIQDGDVVYIRQQPEVENGQIAAVIVNDDNEATLKRFYRIGDTVTLNPENPTIAPMVFVGDEINSVRIVGRAVAYTHVLK